MNNKNLIKFLEQRFQPLDSKKNVDLEYFDFDSVIYRSRKHNYIKKIKDYGEDYEKYGENLLLSMLEIPTKHLTTIHKFYTILSDVEEATKYFERAGILTGFIAAMLQNDKCKTCYNTDSNLLTVIREISGIREISLNNPLDGISTITKRGFFETLGKKGTLESPEVFCTDLEKFSTLIYHISDLENLNLHLSDKQKFIESLLDKYLMTYFKNPKYQEADYLSIILRCIDKSPLPPSKKEKYILPLIKNSLKFCKKQEDFFTMKWTFEYLDTLEIKNYYAAFLKQAINQQGPFYKNNVDFRNAIVAINESTLLSEDQKKEFIINLTIGNENYGTDVLCKNQKSFLGIMSCIDYISSDYRKPCFEIFIENSFQKDNFFAKDFYAFTEIILAINKLYWGSKFDTTSDGTKVDLITKVIYKGIEKEIISKEEMIKFIKEVPELSDLQGWLVSKIEHHYKKENQANDRLTLLSLYSMFQPTKEKVESRNYKGCEGFYNSTYQSSEDSDDPILKL